MKDERQSKVTWALGRLCHLQHNRIHVLMDDLGLYRGQGRALDVLWRNDGCTHGDLAQALSVQPATVSKMIQRMERSGFVARRADPKDQRVSRVFLTEAGRQVKQQVDARFDQLEREAIEGLSAQDVNALHQLLTRIRENLARVSESRTAEGPSRLQQDALKERM